MNSTALIVLEKGVYAVIADVIEEMTLEDMGHGLGEHAWIQRRATPARVTSALLTLERHRMMTQQPIHPLADIHSAFSLLVPVSSR